ncbi:MAG: hypothetical protein PHR26_01925 [Candidatus ainarchaeum sp.]|nr:hypothetical protein [Candidatus ainarchaeum sp.]MDD3975625.1 hypothetical protein [Candidatus ainarchaeum sp.]
MISKYLFLFFSFILIIGSAFAYSDYGINDVYIKNSITSDENFDVNVTISNNSKITENIEVSFKFYSPQAILLKTEKININIPSNSSKVLSHNFNGIYIGLSSSTQPHSLYIEISDPIGTGNSNNNTFIKYFTVAKSSEKIPIPDMPYYIGIFVALFAGLFIYKSNFFNKN